MLESLGVGRDMLNLIQIRNFGAKMYREAGLKMHGTHNNSMTDDKF